LGCSCRLLLYRQEKEKEKEHFTLILFTFPKTYEEKFPKIAQMTKNTLKIPIIYRKFTPKPTK
jgi:hypothetical protein